MIRSERAPKARRNQIVIKKLANETLVYDERNHQAHCLNETAAFVWKHCDGRTTVPKMARLLERELKAAVPEQIVWLAIKQLEESHLLNVSPLRPAGFTQTSRRDLIRTLGVAAVAVPIITSLAAPRAAAAATPPPPPPCRAQGFFCSPPNNTQANCCAGLICNPLGLCVTAP